MRARRQHHRRSSSSDSSSSSSSSDSTSERPIIIDEEVIVDKQFVHEIVLDVQDGVGTPLEMPFKLRLDVVVSPKPEGRLVTIRIPAFNFNTPAMSNPPAVLAPLGLPNAPGGFVYTKSGFLPKALRPRENIYIAENLGADNSLIEGFAFGYDLYITNEGGFRVVGLGDQLIVPGAQNVHGKTVSYFLPTPPAITAPNFRLSQGLSQATKFVGTQLKDQFLEYYANSATHNRVAWVWADNHDVTESPFKFNTVVRIGNFKKHGKKRTLEISDPVTVINPPLNVFPSNSSISINPSNPDNIVVTTDYIDRSGNAPFQRFQIWRAVSFDGGKTFPIVGRIDNTTTIPPVRTTTYGLFDKFGNYWVTYIRASTPNYAAPNNLVILVSSDGGKTFRVAYESTDADATGAIYDYPDIAFGGDGAGGYGLWFAVDFLLGPNQVITIPRLGFIPITGRGEFAAEPRKIIQLNSFNNTLQLPEMTVSDDGKVFIYWIINPVLFGAPAVNLYSTSLNNLETYLTVFPQGVDELRDGNFGGPWLVGQTNIGPGPIGIVDYLSPSQPIFQRIRGVVHTTRNAIVYDDKRGLLYLFTFDMVPNFSQNMFLRLSYSENLGQSWSEPIDISDVQKGNRAHPTVALDRQGDRLVFGWHDARRDQTNEAVDYFGAYLALDKIDELRGTTKAIEHITKNMSAVTLLPNTLARVSASLLGRTERGATP